MKTILMPLYAGTTASISQASNMPNVGNIPKFRKTNLSPQDKFELTNPRKSKTSFTSYYKELRPITRAFSFNYPHNFHSPRIVDVNGDTRLYGAIRELLDFVPIGFKLPRSILNDPLTPWTETSNPFYYMSFSDWIFKGITYAMRTQMDPDYSKKPLIKNFGVPIVDLLFHPFNLNSTSPEPCNGNFAPELRLALLEHILKISKNKYYGDIAHRPSDVSVGGTFMSINVGYKKILDNPLDLLERWPFDKDAIDSVYPRFKDWENSSMRPSIIEKVNDKAFWAEGFEEMIKEAKTMIVGEEELIRIEKTIHPHAKKLLPEVKKWLKNIADADNYDKLFMFVEGQSHYYKNAVLDKKSGDSFIHLLAHAMNETTNRRDREDLLKVLNYAIDNGVEMNYRNRALNNYKDIVQSGDNNLAKNFLTTRKNQIREQQIVNTRLEQMETTADITLKRLEELDRKLTAVEEATKQEMINLKAQIAKQRSQINKLEESVDYINRKPTYDKPDVVDKRTDLERFMDYVFVDERHHDDPNAPAVLIPDKSLFRKGPWGLG